MVRRTSRSDSFVDKPRLLEELGACRKAVLREQMRMRVSGPLYYAAATVVAAIDALALMLTGNGRYFWEQMRTSRPNDQPDGDGA